MDSCEINGCDHGPQYKLDKVWVCYFHFWMFKKAIESADLEKGDK